jgi:hypothetical protein
MSFKPFSQEFRLFRRDFDLDLSQYFRMSINLDLNFSFIAHWEMSIGVSLENIPVCPEIGSFAGCPDGQTGACLKQRNDEGKAKHRSQYEQCLRQGAGRAATDLLQFGFLL